MNHYNLNRNILSKKNKDRDKGFSSFEKAIRVGSREYGRIARGRFQALYRNEFCEWGSWPGKDASRGIPVYCSDSTAADWTISPRNELNCFLEWWKPCFAIFPCLRAIPEPPLFLSGGTYGRVSEPMKSKPYIKPVMLYISRTVFKFHFQWRKPLVFNFFSLACRWGAKVVSHPYNGYNVFFHIWYSYHGHREWLEIGNIQPACGMLNLYNSCSFQFNVYSG